MPRKAGIGLAPRLRQLPVPARSVPNTVKKALHCSPARIVRLRGCSYRRPVIAPSTIDLLRHLAGKPGHDEVKADIRQLLIDEFGAELSALDFEHRVPVVRGRLDALIGRTILEAKRDLDKELADVERKMPEYLGDREREEGEKFVGIASDGRRWIAYELEDGKLIKIKEIILDLQKLEPFLAWLDGVVALKASLPPDPLTIRIELGQDSVAFRRAGAALAGLWGKLSLSPPVALKRQLWAQLLKLVYGREVESDALWFQHTFLVIAAKCIALAVLGLREDDPKRLLSGEPFQSAGISGAVESDFFDWVVADSEGEDLVRRIMAHVRRFRLAEVESDVLKILYESLIDCDQRHGLGEYYTPDWLAAKMVKQIAVDRPLVEHPCSIRLAVQALFCFTPSESFLKKAVESDMNPELRAAEVYARIDGHGYSPRRRHHRARHLSVGARARCSKDRGAFYVPGLSRRRDAIIDQRNRRRQRIDDPRAAAARGRGSERRRPTPMGREQLDFPDTFCRDPALFDKAIERMRSGIGNGHVSRADRGGAFPHHRAALPRRRDGRAKAGDKAISAKPMSLSTSSGARAAIRCGLMSRAIFRGPWPFRPPTAGPVSSSAIRLGSPIGI